MAATPSSDLPTGGKPLILLESAGQNYCSIFRIPDSLADVNPKAYKPKVVSIGPYHCGEKQLEMIQQHKFRFMQVFLYNAKENGVEEQTLIRAVEDMEEVIRVSYSEELVKYGSRLGSDELVRMMMLDGCFILTLFLIVSRIIKLNDAQDPIFTIPWILPSIRSDLLLLENQVPFKLLKKLFEVSKMDRSLHDLNKMAFEFFNFSISYTEVYWQRNRELVAKHLLDLIRMTFIPRYESERKPSSYRDEFIYCMCTFFCMCGKKLSSGSQLILSAKRLRLQGIHIRLRSDKEATLDIRLMRNKLQIPRLRLDGFISSLFLNCVAFEQLNTKSTNHITSYVCFMGCLLYSEEDATFLCNNKRIIENYFGNDNEVSQFFKTICRDVVFDIDRSYLKDVFDGVNEYTSRWYSGLWSGFKHTHFESPWTGLSSFAVVLVILLAMLQATVAILSFLHDKKSDGNAAPP